MHSISIPLGCPTQLEALFSFPNSADTSQTLEQTILHWFNQTLERDGLADTKARVSVIGGRCVLELQGPEAIQGYAEALTLMLRHGQDALAVIERLKTEPKTWPDGLKPPAADLVWDPQNTGQWRFFLPLGMAMLNQRALNFFHYPPSRLLDPMRDYLNDPVPVRLIELMKANGVKTDAEAWLFSTVMDGAPIAAPDNQGTQYIGNWPNQRTVHLIPIESFHQYQRAQVELLLRTSEQHPDYTIPMVVYGSPACADFADLYLPAGESLKPMQVRTVEIIAGKKTAVIGASHPYKFYAQAQVSADTDVGLGHILADKCAAVTQTMVEDLTVVRWQLQMAEDPSQDPHRVFAQCRDYWRQRDTARDRLLCSLVQHQGSLYYSSPESLDYRFNKSMQQAEDFCAQHDDKPCAPGANCGCSQC